MSRRGNNSDGRYNPGYGMSEAPDFELRDDHGAITGVGWSRPDGAQKPERYDDAYPDKRRPGYRIYLLFFLLLLPMLICVFFVL